MYFLQDIPEPMPSSNAAFGEAVQERLTPKQIVQTLCTSLDMAPTKAEKDQASRDRRQTSNKRVSKFKQRQMKAQK